MPAIPGLSRAQAAKLFPSKQSVRLGSKRVCAPLGTPGTDITAAAVDYLTRTLFRSPVTTTRWRWRHANRNVRLNTAPTTPLSSVGVYLGTSAIHATPSVSRWNGNFVAAPTQAVPAYTTPVDGSDYVSPWVTDPALQFVKGEDRLLSWNTSAPASGSGWAIDIARQVWRGSTNGAANVAVLAPAGMAPEKTWIMGDIRIEYEFEGTESVGAFFGDSITAGAGSGDLAATMQGTLLHEAWPGVAAQSVGFCAINLGISSAQASVQWIDATKYATTRADLATTVPDFAVVALGTNDVASNGGYTSVQQSYISVINMIRALGIRKIYACTVIPRNDWMALQGTITDATTVGATSIISTISPSVGGNLLIGSGGGQETAVVTAVSGSGPYTVTTAALTKAHKAGEQIATGYEFGRQMFNDWLRQVPLGLVNVIDFDLIVAASRGSAIPDPRLISADGVHPYRAGYQAMANMAASVIRP